jgi:dihydrofolate synthase / folylpolyglutamate synthase
MALSFEELKELLFQRSNFGMKLGLERMREALSLLGDPHLAFPVLHVAGSNGKGSTCAFAEAALRAAGLRTGLYTSPHLVHFCERIRVAGEAISEERAAGLLEEIVGRVPWALRDDGLTFFELATLMGFLAFAQDRVQVAVIEVGLGGRLDATNAVEPLACAVAPIALEHTRWLGDTLAQVAAEKAGILKRGAPAASAGQPRAAADVLRARALELGIPLWRPGRDYVYESSDVRPFCYEGPGGFRVRLDAVEGVVGQDGDPGSGSGSSSGGLALAGHFQRGNAALACALLQIAARRGLPVRAEHVREGLRTARWPGRLEAVAERPLVLLDGAHNPHAARALAHALPALTRGRPVQLVFAAMSDKDHAAMLRELLPAARRVHLCAVESPRAEPAERLAAVVRGLGSAGASVYLSVRDALQAARAEAGSDGCVLCCGSLYLAAEIAAALGGRPAPRMPSERL